MALRSCGRAARLLAIISGALVFATSAVPGHALPQTAPAAGATVVVPTKPPPAGLQLGSGSHDAPAPKMPSSPLVVFDTDRGTFQVILDRTDAPETTAQFTALVARGCYNGTILHSGPGSDTVEADVAADGAGHPVTTAPPIRLEEGGSGGHPEGVIAMVRAGQTTSSGTRFYIVTGGGAKGLDQQGDCVFGRVFDGIEIAELLLPGDRINTVTSHEVLDNHSPIPIKANFDGLSRILLKANRTSMVVRIQIFPDGTADYAILSSTGDKTTDDAILASMRHNWRWLPAAADGHAVAATLVQNIYANHP